MRFLKSVLLPLMLCAAITALSVCGGLAEKTSDTEISVTSGAVIASITKISSHGNVRLSVSFDEMTKAGMETGDIISVQVGENGYEMPICSSVSEVDSGNMLCWFDSEDNVIKLCVNGDSFAEATGIAEKETIEADPGYQWKTLIDSVTLTLQEKQGYAAEYEIRKLERTNERGDYPALSDEAFANFRCVTASGLKPGVLYRSSTPLDDSLGRSDYVMRAMENAGIKTVLNLHDTENAMKEYSTFSDSYYSACNIANIVTGYRFNTEEFAESVRKAVLFINANEGPYLVHCKEGKDRTGMLCAILIAYTGGTCQEILDDYMLTYENYYGIETGTEIYEKIADSCLAKSLEKMFDVEDAQTADLQAAATAYLLKAGLSESDLAALSEKIAG